MWKVYILKCQRTGLLYSGITQNLERRVKEHNAGKSKFTSGHVPWKLIYQEACSSNEEARTREKYLKSAAGKKFLIKKLSEGSLPD